MNIYNIHSKGYNLSVEIDSFSFTNLDTITNTVTVKKLKLSAGTNSASNTVVTIKKESTINLNVNSIK